MKRKPTDAELMEASAYQATLGNNHPDYYEDLETMAIVVSDVAKNIASVSVIEGRDPHIELRTHNARHRSQLIQTGVQLGHLFEAPVMRVAPPDPLEAAVSYKQPPRHSFYSRWQS